MGKRDERCKVEGTIELDEGYFTTEDQQPKAKASKGASGASGKQKSS